MHPSRLWFPALFLFGPLLAAQNLVGVYRTTPGLVHPLIAGSVRNDGAPLNGDRLTLHPTVPLEVVFVPGKREGEFSLRTKPEHNIKKFILPGLLNTKLTYGKSRQRDHRFSVSGGRNAITAKSESGTYLKLRNFEICFLDLSNDGAFGAASDGYVVKEPGEMQWTKPGQPIDFRAMRDPIEIGKQKLWFQPDPAGFTVLIVDCNPFATVDGKPFDPGEDFLGTLKALNESRAKLGFGPVVIDPALSDACYEHALYCAEHGLTHYQDPAKTYATAAGALAGKNSVIATASTMRLGYEMWLTSFFHRIYMLNPALTTVGMGAAKGASCMDVQTTYRPSEFEPYAWPPAGEQGVSTSWMSGESPHPLGTGPSMQQDEAQRYGYPITLTFPDQRVSGVVAKLFLGESEVPVFVTSPEKPSVPQFDRNFDTIFLMAQAPLQSGASYRVAISCLFRGKPFQKTWTFSTR